MDPRTKTSRPWPSSKVYNHLERLIKAQNIVPLAGSLPKLRVLDLGAGYGQSIDVLGDLCDLTLFDLEPKGHLDDSRWTTCLSMDSIGDRFDVVLLSNVLNVQEHKQDLDNLMGAAHWLTRKHGMIICNYPNTPRKMGWSAKDMQHYLLEWVKELDNHGQGVYTLHVDGKEG